MRFQQSSGKRRPRYSDKHYKKLVIPDQDEINQQRSVKQQREKQARSQLMAEAGTLDVYRQEQERKKQEKRKRKMKRMLIRLGGIAACIIMIVFVAAILWPKSASASYSQGYEVMLNGNILGVTDSPEPVTNALESIRQEFASVYNMKVFDDTAIEYNPVKIDKQFICPPEYFVQILKQSVDVKVVGWVISVNNAPAAAVRTQDEAQAVLDKILQPFMDVPTDRKRVEVGFVENVQVQERPVEYSQLLEEQDAYMLMKYGGNIEEKYHIVVRGESLYAIAKHYKLKVADLRKANPSVASTDKIYPGDELLVIKPQNRVNVKFVEEVDRVEPMPFETEVIEDDTMYVTERRIQQEGVDGVHDINARITFINGVEVRTEVLAEEILTPPVNRVIIKGTKDVPRIMELAAEGRMPIPLKSGSYWVSSPFGPRNINVPGASKWHKGVDMAANKGTPIYASYSGTVTHSGSGTGYGLYIKIKHDGGVETRYAHCSKLIAQKGDNVKQGDLIALVGNTGISGGNHLHWEVRIDGKAWDPLGDYPTAAP